MTTARENFVAGMEASEKQREAEQAHRRRTEAADFHADDGMERLLRLRAERPAEFDRVVTGGLLIQLAQYEEAKANAAGHDPEGATA